MPTVVLAAQVYPQSLANKQAQIPLKPLAGVTGQVNEVEVSPWIAIPGGSYLELALVLTAIMGTNPTLCVYVETCHQIDTHGVAVDAPRFLGSFKQSPGASLPSSVQMTGNGPCDNYVRVTAVPGAGNTSASWTVSGQAVLLAFANAMSAG